MLIRRVWQVRKDDWNRIFLNQLRHKLGSRLTCELEKFKVEANNPLSTFAPEEWIGLYLVICLWHSHLRSVWNVTLKHWNWEGCTVSEITKLARVQLQLQTAVAYACESVKPDTPLQIEVDAKIKWSVSPNPDSCGCGLRHFLLTSDRSWVAEAMSCVTSSWRNEAISMVTCVFFSFALVEILLSCPSCAWRKDRLILPSYQWKCSSGRTCVKAVVSWCFGLVQSPNDVKQRLTATPWNILKHSCLLSLNLSTQNLSKNGTVPLAGKFSPLFEKRAKVIRDRSLLINSGGRIWGLNKVKFSRSPFECYFTEVIPHNNFWWLSRSLLPTCPHFPSKFEWPTVWILPKFSAIPPFGFSVTSDPPFCSSKIKWPPLKSPLPSRGDK